MSGNPTLPGFFQDGGNSLVRQRVPLDKTIYFLTEVDNGDSGAAKTLNLTNGNKQKLILTDDVTITFIDPVGPTNLIIKIVQDAVGGRVVTWPAGKIYWPDGAIIPNTPNANAIDIYGLYFDGEFYYANISPNMQLP